MTRRDARKKALQVLYESDMRGVSVGETIARESGLDSYAKRVLQGVESNRDQIDALLSGSLEHWSIERTTPVDRAILRIGIWELVYGGLPRGVAIDEAIELAREFSSDDAARFVNGVLAGIAGSAGLRTEAGAGGDV